MAAEAGSVLSLEWAQLKIALGNGLQYLVGKQNGIQRRYSSIQVMVHGKKAEGHWLHDTQKSSRVMTQESGKRVKLYTWYRSRQVDAAGIKHQRD